MPDRDISDHLWTSAEIAAATGGAAQGGDWSASGLSIDTRSIQSGDLFVPLRDIRDGHDFIPQAFEGGATAVLSEKELPDNQPAVIVNDSLHALQDMAVAARERSDALRVAVTGSVGKTSVKDALFHMFSALGKSHKSLKSFNNHWGVPLTLAKLPKTCEFAVFETGMNHAGELTELSNLVQPDIAVITTVGGAHLAHFENVEAIADAKAEIMTGLSTDGVLILNGDNGYTPRIAQAAEVAGKRVMTFGRDENCDVVIVTAQSHASGNNIRLRIAAQQYDVSLSLVGAHWVSNAAACMAVAHAAGLDIRKAARSLRELKPASGRGETHNVDVDGKAVTLIDDSYNANPVSMRAAISVLGMAKGRKLAVLGDMYELGKDELALHADLSEPLQEAGVSKVVFVGECMRALKGALPATMRGAWVSDWEAALAALEACVEAGDTVLVKGSNATGLGQLVSKVTRGDN